MKAKGRPALVEQTPELVPVTSLHNLHLSTNVSTEPKLVEHSTPSDPAVLQSRETSSPAFDTQSFLSSSLDSGVGGVSDTCNYADITSIFREGIFPF